MQNQYTFSRRILPLAAAQFFGILIDNAFKLLTLLILFRTLENPVLNSIFILYLTGLYLIPSAINMAPAGFLADRLPKRYVILLANLGELLLLLLALLPVGRAAVPSWWMILMTAGLMFPYLFASPAITGLLPELFQEKELSRANGTLYAFSLLGTVAGISFVLAQHFIWNGSAVQTVYCLLGFSLIRFLISLAIPRTISTVQRHPDRMIPVRGVLFAGWREICRTKGIFLAAFGDAFFVALSLAVMMLLGFFGCNLDRPFGAVETALLRSAPLLGLAAGCWLTGLGCRRKIELGIVPFGAAGMALFLLLGAYVPGPVVTLSPTLWPGAAALVRCFPLTMLWLFLAGINGGLFLIPIRAYFQERVRPELRGTAHATKNAFSFLLLCFINFIYLALVIGNARKIIEVPAWLGHFPDVSPRFLLASVGLLTLVVTLISLWRLPGFALRFLFLSLGHLFYRIRVKGLENIPERGPALLVANHVSFIDNILINSCTSRPIRFLMQEGYFNRPLVHWMVSLTGFIRVPASRRVKDLKAMVEEVKAALRNGELVCVFPEGAPSRNGIIGRFTGGFQHMLSGHEEIPVIPVSVERLWGSVFSYFYGPIRLRLPKAFPYHAAITFGKPVPPGTTPFELRQTICEMAADDAQLEMPDEHPVHYFLARYAKHHPFQVVMRDAANGKSFTFFTTCVAAILFSRRIRKMTAPETKYVGVLLPNCSTAAISIMGCLFADKVPCPLNFSTSQEILERSIRKAKITLVLTSRLFLSKVRLQATPEMVFLEDLAPKIPLWEKLLTMLEIIVLPYTELLNVLAPLSCNDNQGEAVLLFSSGTTGNPKGVVLTHHNLFASVYAETQALAFNPKRDCMFGNLPLFHSFGMNTGLWLPFMVRCRPMIYVNSPLDAKLIGESILKYKVPILVATPSFLQTYLKKFDPKVFDVLRIVVSGAEKLRQDVAERFKEAVNGKLEIVEGYGCTELAPSVTFNMPAVGSETGHRCGKKGSIGQGLQTVCIRIMDPLTLKPVPPDAEGLLFVKGGMVMQGYLDDPEQTAKVLIDGYYNTGDIAKMDDAGYVTVCGRLSRFSKIAGEMVPHEMVECIINELCGLENRVVAVSGIPDPQKGEALLVLYTDEMPLTPAQVVGELRERSISNLWIPKEGNFEHVDALPILGSGKLDLQLLSKVAADVAARRAR